MWTKRINPLVIGKLKISFCSRNRQTWVGIQDSRKWLKLIENCKSTFIRDTAPSGYYVNSFFLGYGHHSGYHQEHHYGPKCEEIEQKSCYNQPKAVEAVKTLVLVLPEPKKKCTPKTLKVPKVSCHTQTENVCIKVPKITQKPVTVKKCVPKIAGEKCDHIELVLPKQICKDLIVGDAHPVPKYPQHPYSN